MLIGYCDDITKLTDKCRLKIKFYEKNLPWSSGCVYIAILSETFFKKQQSTNH